MREASLAICCSGTATLECMLAEIPTTVIYKTNLINYWIYKLSTIFVSHNQNNIIVKNFFFQIF